MTDFYSTLDVPPQWASGVVPRQPLPPSFMPSGDPNPFAQALLAGPQIPTASTPPPWMRQAVVDMARPFLDAGQWLGGVMAGNVQPTAGDAITNLGGAALAGIGPPGGRPAGAAERAVATQMAEHGLFPEATSGIRAYHGSP